MYFPPGYQPLPNGFNWLLEPFDNNAGQPATACGGCHSPAIGVGSDGNDSCHPYRATHTYICTQPGRNPRFQMQYSGGSLRNNAGGCTGCGISQLPSNSLRTGIWYDLLWHLRFSTRDGEVQWWLKSGSAWVKEGDVRHRAIGWYTASSPDCDRRHNSCWPLENINIEIYHYWATWPESVYFQDFVVGPSAASVGEPSLARRR